MTAKELLKAQIDDAGYQLAKVLEGMSDEQMEHRVTTSSMTPKEAVNHLGEAYQAFITECEGGKHSWGTFSFGEDKPDAMLSRFWELRERASKAALEREDDVTTHHANAYIIAHDYYHVGQLCASRLTTEPTWNPYSIYNH